MSTADVIAANFPVLRALELQRSAEATGLADAELVHLCAMLRDRQPGRRQPDTIAPQDWESFQRDTDVHLDLVRRIAKTPVTSRVGLRAKALALHALLDEGTGDLHEEAAAPDQLAWSLVQDILTE